jgi:hypothetical protein
MLETTMKNRHSGLIVAEVVLLVSAVPVFAHHGQAAYDFTKLSTVKGTVSAFDFVNPHILVHVDVKGSSGVVEKWVEEGSSPNMLVREGWNKNTLKPGDQIVATGHLARNGTKMMLIEKVILSNGRTVSAETLGN